MFRTKTIKGVRQAENAECGLACLTMLLCYHGRHTQLRALRASYPSPDAGLNLETLAKIASDEGLAPRAVRLEMHELDQLNLPCILHWDYNHYVVLERVSKRHCRIHNPALGTRTYTHAQISRHFTGIALECQPRVDFSPRAATQTLGLSKFILDRTALYRFLGKTVALSLVLQAIALLSPYYIQTVVDDVLTRADTDFLLLLALGFAVIAILDVLLGTLRAWLGTLFGQQLAYNIASGTMDHLLRLPLSWFASRHSGDIASRFRSLDAVRSFLTQGLAFSIIDGFMAICFVVVMWLYAPTLTAVVVGSVVLYLLLRWMLFNPQREANADYLAANANQSGLFLESLKVIASFKSYSREAARLKLWQKSYTQEVNTNIKLARLNLTFSETRALLFALENVLVIYLGAKLIIESPATAGFTVGMLYAFIAYKNQFKERISGLTEYLIEYRLLRVHFERLADIAHAQAEDLQLVKLPAIERTSDYLLVVKNLHYAYPDRPELLQDINLRLKQGQCLAIGGPSGCGKSTLLRLIASLTELQSGTIELDGLDLSRCPLRVWRSMIACVSQEDGLVSGSIADNVALFSEPVDTDLLNRCAQTTGLADMIANLPLGWETRLGELGVALSAGQQQRVLLTRALYSQPKLLILDEATAHLDEASEATFFERLKQLRIGTLIVSHRPSIHRVADQSVQLRGQPLLQQRIG